MGKKWVGQPVERFEDRRLLMGKGTFIDDIQVAGVRYAAILRSPYAHANIKSINYEKALEIPGVVGVLTGADVLAMSEPFPVGVPRPPKYYSAATDKVRFVGEPVAVVVATDRYIAEDALDVIEVDYEPLPAVTDVEKALEPGAPILHDYLGDNVAIHRHINYGDVEEAFKNADIVVKEKFYFPSYTGAPMETYGVIASWDQASSMMTIWANFHGPFTLHGVLASALKIPQNKMRVIVPADIGGSFGLKSSIYPYMGLLALVSKKFNIPVKWTGDRREDLMAGSRHTDRTSYYELAASKDGKILGMRTKIMDNVGAYIRAPEPATLFRTHGNFLGGYDIRNLEFDAWGVMCNKQPTGPYRGYGCHPTYFSLERMIDKAAKALGIDAVEMRRINLVKPEQMPYTTVTGGKYDAGNYLLSLEKAVEASGYEELRKMQEEARKEGRLVGIGITTAVDPTVSNMGYVTVAMPPEIRQRPNYNPKSGSMETCSLTINAAGTITVCENHCPEGQGHETAIAQIVADELGVHPADVVVISEFDTAQRTWSVSTGSYSSRFASIGSSAIALCAREVREQVLKIAAHELGVAAENLDMENGYIYDIGDKKKKITLKRIAGVVHWNPMALPDDIEPKLNSTYTFSFPETLPPDPQDRVNSSATYGFVCDIAAVEVDPKTGQTKILKYVTVHDAGALLNPLIVEGQIYGSFLQAYGGAFWEELVYDEYGQMLTGTFGDYLCPTSAEAEELEIHHLEIPSPRTVLGSKGCGESCSMTTPIVLANAVADALKPLNLDITELPMTPSKLWTRIKQAQGAK